MEPSSRAQQQPPPASVSAAATAATAGDGSPPQPPASVSGAAAATACAGSPPQPGDTLVDAALKVLRESDPWRKAAYTQTAVQLWQSGAITRVADEATFDAARDVPARPARPCDKVRLVAPGDMPRLGRGGTLASRQAIIHSLVHIELAAVDLSWDIIARFGSDPSCDLPSAFFDDFVQVAADEASHFSALCRRLEALGSHYGAFPAHDGLWESAAATAHSLAARLAVEHCVHEARGLDVLPQTILKFANNGDAETAALLRDVIYAEEISHCAAGVRWLTHLHALAHRQQQQPQQQQPPPPPAAAAVAGDGGTAAAAAAADAGSSSSSSKSCGCGPDWAADARQHATVEGWFHALIRGHFHGSLKPPFNEAARAQAGFDERWYLPLSTQEQPAVAGSSEGSNSKGAAALAPALTACHVSS